MTAPKIKISVIIATYNRSQILRNFLESLLSLEDDGSFDYEIIVVDNNSSDDTKEVLLSCEKKFPQVRYIFEGRQGKSYALNNAMSQAQGDVFVFTDDDVLVDKNWLLNIARFFGEHDVDALGGKVLPLYPESAPSWIKDCRNVLSGPIVCHDYGEKVLPYDMTMLPFVGANMAIKRNIFKEIGGLNPDIGIGKGTMGEDTEYFRRIQRAGKKIFYNPDVLIYHPVDKDRMSLKYFAKWHMSLGKYLVLKNTDKLDKNLVFIFGIPRYLFGEFFGLLGTMIKSIKDTPRAVAAWCDLFIRVGMMQAHRSRIKAQKNIVLYDGNCALCRKTIRTIAFFDLSHRVKFINALSVEVDPIIRELDLKSDDLLVDMHIIEGTKSWKGYEAYQRISLHIPLLWILVPFLYFPPIKYVGQRIYRKVADSRTCPIEPARTKR